MTDQDLFNVIVDICKKVDFSQHSVRQNIWESIFDKILGFSVIGGDVRKIIVPNSLDINIVDVEFLIVKEESISFRVGFCNTVNIAQEQEKFVSMLKSNNVHIGILISYNLLIYVYDINMRSFVVIDIELSKDNKKGAWWVNNFKKSNFDKDNIINYLQHNDKEITDKESPNKKENLIDLQQFCQSVTPNLLQQLLLQHFKKVLTEEQANFICKSVDITVKSSSVATVPQYSSPVLPTPDMPSVVSNMTLGQNKIAPVQFGHIVQDSMHDQAHQFRTLATNVQTKAIASNGNMFSNMDRTKAVQLVRRHNIGVGSNISFLLENKLAHKYVAKVPLDYLKTDWCLILNDSVNKRINVFFVPGKTLNNKTFYTIDKRNFNIQIRYSDLAYQDELSKFRLDKFWVKDIAYD
ncbi:MAG: hypothetical protein LBK70_02260 [Clostridiales bacterium]|jgi:hypothetical protein|nr:hypothetical protein [Clostridiales bacterium]